MIRRILNIVLFFTIIFSFVFVYNNREVTFLKHKKQQATSQETKEDSPISSETITEKLPTITNNTKVAPKETTPTKTEYTTITLGQSDTDESYSPSISPCEKPIGFKIGNYDSRFSISKETFIATTQSAANLWNNALGKTILYYDPDGQLTINLTYDERQAKTDDRGFLALDIENAKQNADTIKQRFESEKITYESNNASFDAAVKTFEAKRLAYETKVDEYNRAGGASQDEYTRMNNELAQLKDDAAKLDIIRADLLVQMKTVNNDVARYNEFVKYINELIAKSNALGGYKFTEGRFVPSTHTIDIYQYDNNNKLFRVIAHELGHALGINHTKNSRSIMYSVNMSTSTSLSKEDIAALNVICSQ